MEPADKATPKRRRVQKQPDGFTSGTIWDENQDVEVVFRDIQGAARIEKIFELYGDRQGEHLDIPWFDSKTGKPNVISDPLNRPLQLSTVAEYEQRM